VRQRGKREETRVLQEVPVPAGEYGAITWYNLIFIQDGHGVCALSLSDSARGMHAGGNNGVDQVAQGWV
jgi:hypothetical protein